MKKILVLVAIIFQVFSFAQNSSVPYRVGNKFGISDLNGKMVIEPQFDKIKISGYKDYYFEGFKFLEKDILSSFIFNGKVILKDKKYHSYYMSFDLIQATKYKSDAKNKVHSDNDSYSTDFIHLYNLDGKLIINNVKEIYCSQLNSENQLSEVIIHTVDTDNLYSLFLYDKKVKKITQTFFKDSDYFQDLQSYNSTIVDYIFKDKNKEGKRITLEVVNNKIKMTSTNDYEFKEEYVSGDYDDRAAAMDEGYNSSEISPLAITDVKQIRIKNKYNNFINRPEQIEIKDYKMTAEYHYILEKEGKKGMLFTRINKMLIPQEFDEIIKSDDYSGYVLKKNNK